MSDSNRNDDDLIGRLLSSRLSRRDLLKSAGVVGAAAAFAPALAACGSGSTTSTASSSAPASSPVKGGRLRIGVIGGSERDVVDPMQGMTQPDNLRGRQLFERLFQHDHQFNVQPALGLSAEPNAKADVWTVKLRPDVTWHNGKPFTSKDVVFTFMMITDPKYPNVASESFGDLDRSQLKALDDLTVQFTLTQPNADFVNSLAFIHATIVPEGYDPKNPVGTGPFTYGQFTPGDRSLFPAFKDYWGVGPYIDEVETIDFADVTAMVNALQGGELDGASNLPAAQVTLVEQAGFTSVTSETGKWNYIFWNTSIKPWSDVRVRQAMRLIMDRQQMVDLALEGYGRVGNDMWGMVDPAYPADTPQRAQDIEQAKSLLKQAGYPDLSFELLTAAVETGHVEAAQVFTQQAKQAGVTVNVKKLDVGVLWGDKYLTWPNGPGWYSANTYLSACRFCKSWNEPHWEEPGYWERIDQAFATVDEAKRTELMHESWAVDYDIGPWDVWAYVNQVDAYVGKVKGAVSDVSGIPFNAGFVNELWLA
jgi:peptide/nickel transport system substrate-binding protein